MGGFRLLLALGLVEMVVKLWQRFVTGTTFYGTVSDAWARCTADLDPDAILTHHGTLRCDPIELACRTGDLVKTHERRAETDRSARRLDEREEV